MYVHYIPVVGIAAREFTPVKYGRIVRCTGYIDTSHLENQPFPNGFSNRFFPGPHLEKRTETFRNGNLHEVFVFIRCQLTAGKPLQIDIFTNAFQIDTYILGFGKTKE